MTSKLLLIGKTKIAFIQGSRNLWNPFTNFLESIIHILKDFRPSAKQVASQGLWGMYIISHLFPVPFIFVMLMKQVLIFFFIKCQQKAYFPYVSDILTFTVALWTWWMSVIIIPKHFRSIKQTFLQFAWTKKENLNWRNRNKSDFCTTNEVHYYTCS